MKNVFALVFIILFIWSCSGHGTNNLHTTPKSEPTLSEIDTCKVYTRVRIVYSDRHTGDTEKKSLLIYDPEGQLDTPQLDDIVDQVTGSVEPQELKKSLVFRCGPPGEHLQQDEPTSLVGQNSLALNPYQGRWKVTVFKESVYFSKHAKYCAIDIEYNVRDCYTLDVNGNMSVAFIQVEYIPPVPFPGLGDIEYSPQILDLELSNGPESATDAGNLGGIWVGPGDSNIAEWPGGGVIAAPGSAAAGRFNADFLKFSTGFHDYLNDLKHNLSQQGKLSNQLNQVFELTRQEFDQLKGELDRLVNDNEPIPDIREMLDRLGLNPPVKPLDRIKQQALRHQIKKIEQFGSINLSDYEYKVGLKEFAEGFAKAITDLEKNYVRGKAGHEANNREIAKTLLHYAYLRPSSPHYELHKKKYEAILNTFAPNGLLEFGDPEHQDINQMLANLDLRTDLNAGKDGTQEARRLRSMAADIRVGINESMQLLAYPPEGLTPDELHVHQALSEATLVYGLMTDEAIASGKIHDGPWNAFSALRKNKKLREYLKEGLSQALGFIPVVNDIRDLSEAFLGRDLVTGEELDMTDRALSALGLVGGSGKFWRSLRGLDVGAIGNCLRRTLSLAGKDGWCDFAGDTIDSATKWGDIGTEGVKKFAGLAEKPFFKNSGKLPAPYKGAGSLKPETLRFTQDSISNKFTDGTPLRDVIDGLKNGSIDPNGFPPVRVFKSGDDVFTLDNRRLKVFQEAGFDIKTTPATLDEVAKEAYKLKTTNGGTSIKVRGGGL